MGVHHSISALIDIKVRFRYDILERKLSYPE